MWCCFLPIWLLSKLSALKKLNDTKLCVSLTYCSILGYCDYWFIVATAENGNRMSAFFSYHGLNATSKGLCRYIAGSSFDTMII